MNEPYKELEKEYAKYVKSKYAVSCNSGTSALHLALLALGIGKGDEVIVPDFTMVACGFAVDYCDATPIFVDCDDTFCIDPNLIEAKITKKTKAIMAVHIYGVLCNMPEILRIAKKHHLKVIEDACEAQGAVFKSKADITCYSFYENKIIHAEEGGMCTTDNKKYAKRMNYLKNMAFGKKHDYFHKEIGYNYRMPNTQAKLALESLKNVDKDIKRRRTLERIFYNNMPIRKTHDAVWVLDYLGKKIPPDFKSFEKRPFFKPLSSMPMWGGKCKSPKAKWYSKHGSYLKI
jgi:perosamine synthetase